MSQVFKKNVLLLIATALVTSCVSTHRNMSSFGNPEVQHFTGKIQVSSLDGKTTYGPPYESTVRRTVNARDGIIEECVLQKGKLFYTLITRTKNPLVYSAIDSDGHFSGTLTFADPSLTSWSYNIQVYAPSKGQLSGSLPENGAVIDTARKKMKIKKIWDGKVLLTEDYDMTDQTMYANKLKAAKSADPALVIRENCK